MKIIDADKLIEELHKQEEFWRNNREDAHGISGAVMVALAEIRRSVEKASFESISANFNV